MNPFAGIKIPRKDCSQKLPTEIVPLDKVKQVLRQPDTSTFKGRMWQAILVTFFGTGCRLNEVRNLRIADFKKSAAGAWFFHLRETKSGRTQQQAIPDWAVKPIANFILERQKLGAVDEDFIFVSTHGRTAFSEPISVSTFQRTFKRYCEAAGVADCSVHSARKTYATQLRAKGFDVFDIRNALRHSSVMTTERYIQEDRCIDRSVARKLSYDRK